MVICACIQNAQYKTPNMYISYKQDGVKKCCKLLLLTHQSYFDFLLSAFNLNVNQISKILYLFDVYCKSNTKDMNQFKLSTTTKC